MEEAQSKTLEIQEQTRLKAKIHLQNVQKTVDELKIQKAKELESKKCEIASKLDKAGQNKAQFLDKVVSKAKEVEKKAQEVGQRRSASKDLKKDED